jgi:hypothetical protein
MTNGPSRSMQYSSRTPEEALAWQKDLRAKLFSILKMDDLVSREAAAAFSTEIVSSEKRGNYEFRGLAIDSTPGRRIEITATVPTKMKGPLPAVVAVDGHSGTRQSCYEPGGNRAYAHVLAEKGYVTVSTRISQHDVQDQSRILMGERLWDLMRCVDFLVSLDEVDSQRIGCAGLSLGGEMTMLLAAMDERIRATISAGFLTRMDQLEAGHCMCWKFPGLRNLVDFTDIYSLIAPRPLLCQNGLKEDPSWFPVSIAREAIEEIKVIYADMECPQNVSLVAHDGGHEIDLPSLLSFFDQLSYTPRISGLLHTSE